MHVDGEFTAAPCAVLIGPKFTVVRPNCQILPLKGIYNDSLNSFGNNNYCERVEEVK
jgi:hypothetical protein